MGVLEDALDTEGIQPAVRDSVRSAVERLAALGASAEAASLPHANYALSAYYLIAPAECSSNLARYDGVRYGYRAGEGRDVVDMNMRTRGEGFGDEVKRRIMLGTFALSAGYHDAYYKKALAVRQLIEADFRRVFAEQCDVLACPVSPTPEPRRLTSPPSPTLSRPAGLIERVPTSSAVRTPVCERIVAPAPMVSDWPVPMALA